MSPRLMPIMSLATCDGNVAHPEMSTDRSETLNSMEQTYAHMHTMSRPSRSQILRDSVVVRLATAQAGPMIAELLKENGIELNGADWSKVSPHWLIATVEESVIGCCQVVVSKPIGYMEFLLVKPSVSFKLRAIALRKLAIQGMSTLYYGGAQYVAGMVAVKDQKFLDVIEKLNVLPLYTAHLVCKRIA